MGHPIPDQIVDTISSILTNVINDAPTKVCEGLLPHSEVIDFLPTNIELAGLKVSLVNTLSKESTLKDYFDCTIFKSFFKRIYTLHDSDGKESSSTKCLCLSLSSSSVIKNA